MAVLGVIGGSGVYDLACMSDDESLDVETPFGSQARPCGGAG